MRRSSRLLLSASLLASILTGGQAIGQAIGQDTAGAPVTVAAGGLVNPRGFAWDAAGALIVAEAGTGGETAATEEIPPPTGPYRGGPTARVSRVAEGGCPVTVADGLPSAVSAAGEPIGAADVALVGDRLLALVAGGGAAHGNPDRPAGLYELEGGEATLVADLSGYLRALDPDAPSPDGDPDGFLFSMVATPAGDGVWIAERSSGQILLVGLAPPVITRLVDLSAEDALPTALAVDAAGALYVGLFSSAPYAAGSAYVLKVAGDDASPLGRPERVWTGLTMVTGLAFGPDGALYATEFSAAPDQPPFFVPGTGRVVRQTGPDTSEEVLTQLDLPTTTRFGPDGALYVSLPAVGADDGGGIVIRADLAGGEALAARAYDLTPPACGAGSEASVDANAIPIEIAEDGFTPALLTITAGTTVAWTNAGTTDHTVVHISGGGQVWDSGPLSPGATYGVTFTEVGTYAYACAPHPDERGTIEVVPSGP